MRSKIAFTVVVGLFTSGAAFATSPPATAPSVDKAAHMQQRFEQHVAKLDKNGDGSLSRDELKGDKGLAKHFDEIDTNKDGVLSKEEMQIHHVAMRDKHKAKFEEQFKKLS